MRPKKRLRQLFRLPHLPLIIVPLILLSPVLFTGKALFWGTPAAQFIPWWKLAFDTLLSGHLPLWNPFVGMGAPLVANYQSALFYPPNWIYFFLYILGDVPAMAWGQSLILTAHLIWSGLGLASLVRRLGLGALGQTISGLAFGLSGYLVARAWFSTVNAAVAWIPWVLIIAYEMSISQKKIYKGLKLGLILGIQLLAGHAQTSWYTWLFAAMWIGFWSWSASQKQQKKLIFRLIEVMKNWGLLGSSIFLGVAVAAIQLLPTAEYLLHSQRASAAEFESAMTYSFWPWRFLGLLAPNIFGNPVHSDYWGYGYFWEDAIYIGVLPLLLAVGVLVLWIFRRKTVEGGWKTNVLGRKSEKDGQNHVVDDHRSTVNSHVSKVSILPLSLPYFLLAIILLSALLALGKNTPIYPWLYHHVPTFDMFRAPTRTSIWLVISLALLAGIGIEQWQRPSGWGLYWTRLGTAGAFAMSLGAGLGWYFLKDLVTDFKPTFVPAIALAGLWGLGSGILSLTAPAEVDGAQPHKNIWQWSVILWVSLDLLVAGWGLNPGIGLDFYQHQPSNAGDVQQMLGDGRLYLLGEDEDFIRFQQFFIFDSFEPAPAFNNLRATMLPNLNMLEGIPVVNNYDPLVPGRYARWMDEIRGMNIQMRDDLLDLMGVTLLEWESPTANLGVRFVPREGASRLTWVPCARLALDEESAWDLVISGQANHNAEVVIEGLDSTTIQSCYSSKVTPLIMSEHSNKVVVQLETQAPGWLVLSDIWYPGWRVWVDGEPVSMFRANYLFRAVEIPSGAHEVVFSYHPISFYAGSVVTILTCLILGGFFVIRKRILSSPD
jgi:hypothetical protein